MDRITLYTQKSLWVYPLSLVDEIINEIDCFYDEYNKTKSKLERIKRFKNQIAFIPLRKQIVAISKYEDKEIPDLRWLVDFYNKRKYGKQLTKVFFEALLTTFNYSYNAEDDTYGKRKAKPKNESTISHERQKILKYVISKSKSNGDTLKDFVGIYKYFVGGRKEDTRYDYIYENEIEIFNNGEIEVRNPFNGHTYTGLATIKASSCLQLISFDHDEHFLDGIGNLLSFKVNKYAKLNKLIPGLSSSFDSDGRLIFAQALLCSDLSLDKNSKIIREYFDKLIKGLRLYSPEIKEVEKLVNKYFRE